MALKSTICKCELNISDLNRHYYQTHSLRVAQHPSENDTRMLLRILAFACFADEQLEFTKGLSTDEEPDLWRKELSGVLDLWLELGQPDEKRLRKACGLAKRVVVISYGDGSANVWWQQNEALYQRFKNLSVYNVNSEDYDQLGQFVERNMELTATIEDDKVWLADQQHSLEVTLNEWRVSDA